MSTTNMLLRELAHNVAKKARWYQEREQHERGLIEVAASIERWLAQRAPLLPDYSSDWADDADGRPTYHFPWDQE
jgi:hypothetical protein